MLLLVLVLIPGIGREINNSTRWISLGFFTLQPSEIAKLSVIIYIAGFLHRHGDAVRLNLRDAIGPVLLLTGLVVLLLKEPDYGAAVVLIVTVMGMMFLAKVNIWHFVVLLGGAAGTMVAVLSLAEYRWLRLMCFLDPWSDPYGCGYQLTQSLIAVGSGGIFGAGLGASIQKLHYLPEAYNDFLFAVLAEELGLVGVISVVGLYSIMIWRMFRISANAEKLGNPFSSYLVSGVALLFGAQTLINMGVNLGLLPPKGLTLPLMSYGGSSMLIMCIALALVLRVAWENCDSNPRRWRKTPVSSRESNSRTASVPVTIGSMDA
jgi:cell division protein FtsW